jgi:hypothetical protein
MELRILMKLIAVKDMPKYVTNMIYSVRLIRYGEKYFLFWILKICISFIIQYNFIGIGVEYDSSFHGLRLISVFSIDFLLGNKRLDCEDDHSPTH